MLFLTKTCVSVTTFKHFELSSGEEEVRALGRHQYSMRVPAPVEAAREEEELEELKVRPGWAGNKGEDALKRRSTV